MKEIRCKSCNRYLATAYGTIIATIKCPTTKCKLDNEVKIVTTDRVADLRFKFPKPEIKKKKVKDE